jgi:hypothetical protein
MMNGDWEWTWRYFQHRTNARYQLQLHILHLAAGYRLKVVANVLFTCLFMQMAQKEACVLEDKLNKVMLSK